MAISSGKTYNRWTVIGSRVDGTRKYPCRCECGTERNVVNSTLTNGTSKSCGCHNLEVLAARGRAKLKHPVAMGQQFGRWTVIDPADRQHVLCRCECGIERHVTATNLLTGASKSCGCWKLETTIAQGRANAIHGLSGHRLYATWKAMVHRCTQPSNQDWRHYGGRGITVHPAWLDIATFIREIEIELGPKPRGLTIDRIDNDSGYRPGNVRWATRKQQSNNRRVTRRA